MNGVVGFRLIAPVGREKQLDTAVDGSVIVAMVSNQIVLFVSAIYCLK